MSTDFKETQIEYIDVTDYQSFVVNTVEKME